jgi:uncharacterized protein YkwD
MAKLQPLSTVNRIIFFFVGVMLIASWKNEQPNYYEISGDSFALLPDLQKPINAFKPDYSLLDAAIFHATNKARQQFGLKLLQYDAGLHQTTNNYAKDMIQLNFYGHVHPYSPSLATLAQRVQIHTWAFKKTAENIGQYQVIDTAPEYCCRRKRDGSFEYFDCENKKLFSPFNYEDFAQYAVEQWMNSPSHRHHVLDSTYTHLGCAARISKDSYQGCKTPFGRFVQNFGALNQK